MKIQVTPDDIHPSGNFDGENPVTRAIRRATGQTWVVFGGTTAYLRSQPYKTVALPYDVFYHWKLHHHTGTWQPFEFEIDIDLRQNKSRRDSDRRGHERRKGPRFGFDRRTRDRRDNERRSVERRSQQPNTPVRNNAASS